MTPTETFIPLLFFIGGTLCVGYREKLTVMALRCLNFLFDCYLWFKYLGYQHQNKLQTYRVTGQHCLNDDHHQRWCYYPIVCDLHKQNYESVPSPNQIYLHYQAGTDEYLLPIQSGESVKFPYTVEEMESCYKIDYKQIIIDSGTYVPEDLIYQQVMQYAGPRGDFYTNTPYQITPAMILDEHGRRLIHQCLQLMTLVDTQFTFSVNQRIKINGI